LKNLTIQNLYEAILEDQVPSCNDLITFFPNTDTVIVDLVNDYWNAHFAAADVRKRIRKLAQEIKSN